METTVYANTSNGYVYSNNATYSTARSTAATADDSSGAVKVGQKTGFECDETFLSFDVDAAVGLSYGQYVIQGVTLYMKTAALYDATEFDIEAVTKDWEAGLTTADWVAGASISGTVRASVNTSVLAVDTYTAFTAGTWEAAGLDSDGNVYLMLYSTRHKAGTEPSGNEYVAFYSADTAGTGSDPYIVVEWYATNPDGGFLEGALGPGAIWGRELTPTEVVESMNQGLTIVERALDAGTAVISGKVRTRSGALVPAEHVRAGWWIQHMDANNETAERPRPLLISGHSVNLEDGKNALTIGVDWMEDEIGVKMADLLAVPSAEIADEAAEPYTPEDRETATGPEAGSQSEAGVDATYETAALSDEYLLTHPWMAPAGYWDAHGETYTGPPANDEVEEDSTANSSDAPWDIW